MPHLVDRRRLARHGALCDLVRAGQQVLAADGVLRRLARDLDDADTRVVGAAVVLAVAEVTEPRLQRGRVVGLHLLAVGDDGGFAGDAGPFARGVEEAEVDLGVGFEVVGFAGLGVGVEDEVDAVALLYSILCQ